jgi:putative inorganic carbon (HCO3(-)) transporter
MQGVPPEDERSARNTAFLPRLKRQGVVTAEICLFFLVGLQVFFNPFPQVTAVHEFGFYGSVILLVFLVATGKTTINLRTPLSIPLGLFLLWTLVGLPFAMNKGNSLHDIYAHLIKYIVLFYLIAHTCATPKRFHILTWLVTLSTALFSFGITIHYYLILGKGLNERLGLVSYSEMPTNIIAVLTVFAAIVSAGHIVTARTGCRKAIASFFLILFAVTTLATGSKGALIAIVVGLLCFFASDRKKLLVFLAAILLIAGVLYSMNYFAPMAQRLKEDPRIGVWYNFYEMAKDHPVVGIGFGMQTYDDDALVRKYNERVPSRFRAEEPIRAPHNLLVSVAVRTGFPGLVLFLAVIVAFLRLALRTRNRPGEGFDPNWGRCILAAFIALLIQGMLENTASGPPAVLMFTLFAMATILRGKEDGSLTPQPL